MIDNSDFEILRNQITKIYNKSQKGISHAKYWYPLSLPNYGVNEIMGSLDSLLNFQTTMWNKTRKFEDLFCEKYNYNYAVFVNSGSSADLLSSFALLETSGGDLKVGDEILAPSVTWPTQIWSLLMAGFRVRLVDTDPRTLNIDLEKLNCELSKGTSKGLALVHLLGSPINMSKVKNLAKDVKILEDACESLGATYDGKFVGSFGEFGTFSFFFSHHMTTMEGGMIVTNSEQKYEQLKLLRAHGWSRNIEKSSTLNLEPNFTFVNWGFNVRPTELQASFGLEQILRIDEFIDKRRVNAQTLKLMLEEYESIVWTIEVDSQAESSWFAFPIIVNPDSGLTKDELVRYLEKNGIETRPIVAGNLAKQPAMNRFKHLITFSDLSGADFIHENGFYIGIHPFVQNYELEKIEKIIADKLKKYK